MPLTESRAGVEEPVVPPPEQQPLNRGQMAQIMTAFHQTVVPIIVQQLAHTVLPQTVAEEAAQPIDFLPTRSHQTQRPVDSRENTPSRATRPNRRNPS